MNIFYFFVLLIISMKAIPHHSGFISFNIKGLKYTLMSILLGLDAYPTTGRKPYTSSRLFR